MKRWGTSAATSRRSYRTSSRRRASASAISSISTSPASRDGGSRGGCCAAGSFPPARCAGTRRWCRCSAWSGCSPGGSASRSSRSERCRPDAAPPVARRRAAVRRRAGLQRGDDDRSRAAATQGGSAAARGARARRRVARRPGRDPRRPGRQGSRPAGAPPCDDPRQGCGVQGGHRRRHRPGDRGPGRRSGVRSRGAAPPARAHQGGARRCGLRLALPGRPAPRVVLLARRREQLPHARLQHAHQPEPHGHGDLLQAGPGRPPETPAAHRRAVRDRGRADGAARAGGGPHLGAAHLLQRPDLRRRQEDHLARRAGGAVSHPAAQPVPTARPVAEPVTAGDARPHGGGRLLPLAAGAVLAALGLVPLANLLGGGASLPWWSAAVRDWLVTGTAIVLTALGLGWVSGERVDRSIARSITVVLGPSPRAFQAFLALLVLTLTGSFALYCFARAPFSQDEMAQRFHAHILLAGRLFAAGEPHPEFFSITGVLDRARRWYSMYPIGGPALLAVGTALHATWLVNPVLTALTACAPYRVAAGALRHRPGRGAVLLFALSPFVLIMGASEMNHVGALALATLALAARSEERRVGKECRSRWSPYH